MKKLKVVLRNAVRLRTLRYAWHKKIAAFSREGSKVKEIKSVLFIPADHTDLVGSKGDEAMLTALATQILQKNPHCKLGLFTDKEDIGIGLSALGFIPESCWDNKTWSLEKIMSVVRNYDALMVIGADVMDGHYTPLASMRRWVVADCAARLGKRSTIVGFSYNENSNRLVNTVVKSITPDLNVLARDCVGYDRLNTINPGMTQLVADSAFMLMPTCNSNCTKDIEDWAKSRKDAGDIVFGFNLHPMLIKNASSLVIKKMIENSISAIDKVMQNGNVSFLFIPHDFRGPRVRDDEILLPIYSELNKRFPTRVMLKVDELPTSELKYIAGLCDVVVTARMHLMIAALGMGVPIAGVTYQGKFEGLYAHFGLDTKYLLNPSDLLNDAKLLNVMQMLIKDRNELKKLVDEHWPKVKALSAQNVAHTLS